jgi:phage gp36-like protein
MSYASQADMVNRFSEQEIIQLTDRNNTGAIDATVLERALADATAEIDGYLAARYQLPLTSTPTVLVRVCSDIARYHLHDDHIPESVAVRYKAAVDLLRQVSMGRVSLGVSDTGDEPTSNDGAEVQSGGRVWDRADSKGFI